MARTIKLPTRAGALNYEPTEVFDIIHTLSNMDDGEGVVVDNDQDTEPKARARARVMAGLVKAGVIIKVDDLPDVPDLTDEDTEYYTEQADDDGNIVLGGLATRTHAVDNAGSFTPMLSVKK